jgi:hypothetical protein
MTAETPIVIGPTTDGVTELAVMQPGRAGLRNFGRKGPAIENFDEGSALNSSKARGLKSMAFAPRKALMSTVCGPTSRPSLAPRQPP